MKIRLLLTLLCALPLYGQTPIKKIAHVFFNHVTLDVVTIASSGFATNAIHNCRVKYGIGPCPGGGYGDFKAREGVRFGFTTGMVVLGELWRRSERDGRKHYDWLLDPAIPLAINVSYGIINVRHKGCPVSICRD